MRKSIARASTGVVIALLLAVAQGAGSANADVKNAAGGEVIVELRVWQDVNDQENLHVSARLQGDLYTIVPSEARNICAVKDLTRTRTCGCALSPAMRMVYEP